MKKISLAILVGALALLSACSSSKETKELVEKAQIKELIDTFSNLADVKDAKSQGDLFLEDGKLNYYNIGIENPIIRINGDTATIDYMEEKNNMGNSKTLVIYSSFIGEQYSVGVIEKGNTEIVADMIIENLGADRYKVEPKNDIYPKDSYKKLTEIASKELHDKARPEIKYITFDISNYDTIFVGAPVWWGDFPMIMYTLFDKVDMNGKTIVPFSTHGGSGLSGFDNKLKRLYPNAKILKGLAITGTDTQSRKDKVKNEVEKWLNEIVQ